MSKKKAIQGKDFLDEELKKVEKKYGKGVVVNTKGNKNLGIESISTGSLCLDLALGNNGIPKGRLTELFGNPSSGKSSLALSVAKQAQKKGETIVWVDMENSFSFDWAKKMGLDIDKMIIVQPDYGEQALDIARIYIESGKVDLVVIDSVASLVPKTELEGEMANETIGLQARMISKALRKLTALVKRTNTALIFINQLRTKIGISFGDPTTSSGGKSIKFYSSVRIKLWCKKIKKANEVIGIESNALVVKNKVSPPFKKASFKIFPDEGVSETADIIDIGDELGVIEKKGAWISYKDYKWQGEDNARKELKEDPKLLKEIRNAVKKELDKDE